MSLVIKECNVLSNKPSKAFGGPIEVYECGYKKMGNLQGIFQEFDESGYRKMAFYFLNSRNEMIGMAGGCKSRTLKVFRKEYEDIIGSLKIK